MRFGAVIPSLRPISGRCREFDFFTRSIFNEGLVERDSVLAAVGGFVGNPTFGAVSLRGLNNDSVFGAVGTRSNALIVPLVDGVFQSVNTARFFPRLTRDVSSFSVIKGGRSVGQGPNAFGGALLYEDSLPEFDWSGRVRLDAGERGLFRSALTQNVTLIEDTLALRFHYEHQESAGSVENVFLDRDTQGRSRRDFVKGQLLWQPENERGSVIARFEYDDFRSNPFAAAKVFGPFERDDRRANTNTRTQF